MSRQPDPEDFDANPDLDAFRDVAGELLLAGVPSGRFACVVQQEWPLVAGRYGRGHEYVYLVVELVQRHSHPDETVRHEDWLYPDNDDEGRLLDDLRGGRLPLDSNPGATTPHWTTYEIRWLEDPQRTSTLRALTPAREV